MPRTFQVKRFTNPKIIQNATAPTFQGGLFDTAYAPVLCRGLSFGWPAHSWLVVETHKRDALSCVKYVSSSVSFSPPGELQN